MKHLEKKKNILYKNKITGLVYEEVFDIDISNWEEIKKEKNIQYSEVFKGE